MSLQCDQQTGQVYWEALNRLEIIITLAMINDLSIFPLIFMSPEAIHTFAVHGIQFTLFNVLAYALVPLLPRIEMSNIATDARSLLTSPPRAKRMSLSVRIGIKHSSIAANFIISKSVCHKIFKFLVHFCLSSRLEACINAEKRGSEVGEKSS